jgi:hypothetical protein
MSPIAAVALGTNDRLPAPNYVHHGGADRADAGAEAEGDEHVRTSATRAGPPVSTQEIHSGCESEIC